MLFLLAPSALIAGTPAKPKMNVLFLAADDLRIQLGVDRVPGTPEMHTPNFDTIIGDSLFLRQAQVQQAVCSPTRTSVLTSRYPDTTRVWDLVSYFRDVGGNYTTIPQLFKEAGYHTTGGGKIFHPGKASGGGPGNSKGDDAPYSWSEPFYHSNTSSYWSTNQKQPGCDECTGHSWISVSPEAEVKIPLPDAQIAENALATLEQHAANGVGKDLEKPGATPFFLAVGFHKPHLPFVAPSRFHDLYPADDIELPGDQQPPTGMPKVAWSNWGELRNYPDIAALNNSGTPGDVLPANVTKALRRAYYAAVSFTDYNIGLVMASLRKHGYYDNTVVSFWGDHGWQLGEHGEWCKHTNFNLATNAPMFVRVPGRTDGGVMSSTPTEYLDLMPTLATAAMGVSVPACPADAAKSRKVQLCTHGTSLLPLIDAPHTAVKRAAYSQYPRGYQKPGGQLTVEEDDEATVLEDDALFDALPTATAGDGVGAQLAPSKCLKDKCTMGYSMLTQHNGTYYRYTEWVDFNVKVADGPDWDRVVGTELYDHAADPMENTNLAASAKKGLLGTLSTLLHQHPVWASSAPSASQGRAIAGSEEA